MAGAPIEATRRRWAALAKQSEGEVKLVPLAEAVRRNVRRGDALYFGGSMARPNAAMFEVARAFWESDPGFTMIAPAIANQHAPLFRAGLIRKAITTIHALTFPSPGPHPLYVDLARQKAVIFENWSLLTFVTRLKAAALGLPFLPTRSLSGSDMASRLGTGAGFAEIADPFSGASIGVVSALAPDVTFVHALAADRYGNAILCPPHYDGKWAALAASRAVIVTAERIVDTGFIRRYQHFVQVPGTRVSAVAEVPLGGHPNSVPGDLVPEIGGYPDDYAFLEDLNHRARVPEELDAWSAEWITGCADHGAYLEKLGASRIHALKGMSRAEGWEADLAASWPRRAGDSATTAERHAVLALRMLTRRLESGAIDSILAGLGISSLAAWMAAITMRERGASVPLMVEAGMFGYLPAPADPFLFNYRNMFTSTMLSDVPMILGVMVGSTNNRAIGVLGAAEVDRDGNINTSELPDFLLTGSGGANDIASTASEVLVTIGHSQRRLVEKVHFVTSPGRAVDTIVTPKAVLQRRQGRYQLTYVLADEERSLADLVADACCNCGFELAVADDVVVEPEPTPDELELCRLLDPKGYFLG